MGEGKWIKTYVNTYDDTPSKMIDSHENRDVIHYVRGRLLALAGKVNRDGELYMTETKPYTIKTLAIEFNRDFEVVKEAIKVLKSLEVIEITEDRVFKISDWEIDQNIEGLERIRKQTSERVARHRAAKKIEEEKKSEEEKKHEVPKKSEGDNKENNEEGNQESKGSNKTHEKNDSISEPDNVNDKSASNASCDYKKLNNIEEKACEGDNSLENNIINCDESESVVNNANEIIYESDINNDGLKCNVTVTQQNKRKGRRRGKKKDKRESKKKGNNSLIEFSCDNDDFEISDDNGEEVFCEGFITEDSAFDDYIDGDETTIFFDLSESPELNNEQETGFNISKEQQSNASGESAEELLKYCENTGGSMPVNITLNALKYAINSHTEKYVKMAIDKSMEVGKFDMAYINGILKNWKREGYPRDEYEGGNINGKNSYGKGNFSDTVKFEGFKPKEPRKLTEGERKIAEENLI